MKSIGIILAGGNSERLKDLCKVRAIAAMPVVSSYRAIDFSLSNMSNSGIKKVAVITQFNSRSLQDHLSSAKWWELDRKEGGLYIFTPFLSSDNNFWFRGIADSIYQNISYLKRSHEPYVVICSGEAVYKMDYSAMLKYHKENNADATIAVLEVPMEDASRFGIMNADENDKIYEFEEKPEHPKSNLASMGIYIFTWSNLRKALIEDEKIHPDSDFGKHIIPKMLGEGQSLYAYRFKDYWKDVGTLGAYWEANMELIDIIPEFNLYEEFWKIYTNNDMITPLYFGDGAKVDRCIIGEGSEIYGEVYNSVIGSGVILEEGTVVRDSIIMGGTKIGKNCTIEKGIVAESVEIGDNVVFSVGDYAESALNPKVYAFDLVTVAENSVIPSNVKIGKNTAIVGRTEEADYPEGLLASGQAIVKAGEM